MATAEDITELHEPAAKPRAPELPDPALFWRWVRRATRPVWGWSLVGLGLIFVLVGYLGISREALVAKQLPYLISGGIGGIALVGFGAMLVGTEDLKRTQERIDHLEGLVEDLHAALLSRPDAPTIPSSNGEANGRTERAAPTTFLALPGGQSYHRADCSMIQGKDEARPVTPAIVRRQRLKPCRLCEPGVPSAKQLI
jgi:hypothetical protein